MEVKGVKEICLYTEDLLSAVNFYNKILGFPIISHVEGKHVFFRAGISVLLCFNPEDSKRKEHPPAHYASGRQHIAFEVEQKDYLKTKEEMINAGVIVTDTMVWESGQESFYFEDPAGHLLEIVPEGIWDAEDSG